MKPFQRLQFLVRDWQNFDTEYEENSSSDGSEEASQKDREVFEVVRAEMQKYLSDVSGCVCMFCEFVVLIDLFSRLLCPCQQSQFFNFTLHLHTINDTTTTTTPLLPHTTTTITGAEDPRAERPGLHEGADHALLQQARLLYAASPRCV